MIGASGVGLSLILSVGGPIVSPRPSSRMERNSSSPSSLWIGWTEGCVSMGAPDMELDWGSVEEINNNYIIKYRVITLISNIKVRVWFKQNLLLLL